MFNWRIWCSILFKGGSPIGGSENISSYSFKICLLQSEKIHSIRSWRSSIRRIFRINFSILYHRNPFWKSKHLKHFILFFLSSKLDFDEEDEKTWFLGWEEVVRILCETWEGLENLLWGSSLLSFQVKYEEFLLKELLDSPFRSWWTSYFKLLQWYNSTTSCMCWFNSFKNLVMLGILNLH